MSAADGTHDDISNSGLVHLVSGEPYAKLPDLGWLRLKALHSMIGYSGCSTRCECEFLVTC